MWDAKKAISHLNAKAQASSTYWCAKYTREAIEAGGITLQRAAEARLYGPSLKGAGFGEVSGSGMPFRAGDVVIIQGASTIKEGHMAMFNGSIWVSDYRQTAAVFPSGVFDREMPAYKIYRHPDAAVASAATPSVTSVGIGGKLIRVGQSCKLLVALSKSIFNGLKYKSSCKNIKSEIPAGSEFKVTAVAIGANECVELKGTGTQSKVELKLSHKEFQNLFLGSSVPAQGDRKSVAGLGISDKGLGFLFGWEAWAGVSNKLHWPGGSSGVTLGAGYDMKLRSKDQIKKDLVAVGVDSKTAEKVAEAAGLSGTKAKEFCTKNSSLVNLSRAAETALLKFVVPQYEDRIRSNVTVKLFQYEFDALTCFCYNIPAGALAVAKLLNANKREDALKEWALYVKSGGNTVQGLVNRRKAELALFKDGKY